MLHLTSPHSATLIATWIIAGLATLCVILRPFRLSQWLWAVGGAVLLVLLGLLPIKSALGGVGKGADVYLFLFGMMLLAEVARQEGLFDWLAAHAARSAKGSAVRLFLLIYGVGILVTTFLSNDATAVVLTPAVAASMKAANVEKPLPYLLICALIANAASFVLPISNPANLVIYGSHMPPLLQWLPRYALASVLSIGMTYLVLRWTQRKALRQKTAEVVDVPKLSASGKTAALGIAMTSIVLLTASALDLQLGLPTAIAGALTAAVVLIREAKAPWSIVRDISWGVLPLVAGLFVLVEALDHTGVIAAVSQALREASARSAQSSAWGAGIAVALLGNLVNNLPAGLIAGTAVQAAHAPDQVTRAILIGVDLGPNLSITGSLATILWLDALKRDGQHVSGATFLKYGLLVMPPALIAALAGAGLLWRL
ncbi:MAG: arsenic transporter [Methylovirgula sp.]